MTRILVIHPGGLGDTLLALPVLAALKLRYAPAALHLIGHPSVINLLPGRSAVDSMFSIDGPEYRELFHAASSDAPGSEKFLRQYDLAVVWTADSESDLARRLAAAGVRQAIVRSPGLRMPGSIHATERFRETVSHLLDGVTSSLPWLSPTSEDRAGGLRWLSEHRIRPGERPVVALHPGSGSRRKCWPPHCFVDVARGLLDSRAHVLIIEGPADAGAVDALVSGLHPAVLPLLRGVDLSTVVGLLSFCSAFLGNDSGLTHAAGALGIPTVAVFGPSDAAVWAFPAPTVTAIRADAPCECVTVEMQQRCVERPCLAIDSKAVLGKLRELCSTSLSLATHVPLC